MLVASVLASCSVQAAHAGRPPAERPWTLALTSGVNAFEHDQARPFGSLSLDRDFGDLSVGLTASIVDSGQEGVVGNVASTTRQLSLSAGYAFGALAIEGHATVGRRRFATERFARRAGAGASLASHGHNWGAGGTLTYDLPIGADSFLSPFVSLDYGRVDIARIATIPAGTFVREQREKGVTGGIGATLARSLGEKARQHNLGLYLATYATSNNAASAAGAAASAGSKRFLEGSGASDRWIEAGPNASLALSETFHLDLAAVRTLGLKSGNATTVSLTLRKAF